MRLSPSSSRRAGCYDHQLRTWPQSQASKPLGLEPRAGRGLGVPPTPPWFLWLLYQKVPGEAALPPWPGAWAEPPPNLGVGPEVGQAIIWLPGQHNALPGLERLGGPDTAASDYVWQLRPGLSGWQCHRAEGGHLDGSAWHRKGACFSLLPPPGRQVQGRGPWGAVHSGRRED